MRATPQQPERPVGPKQVQAILQNPYYTGRVIYQGVEYQGAHTALVTLELFALVQERIEERRLSTEKPRKHWHHLTGTVKCARCGCGLVHNVVRSRNGERYAYFTCIGRLTYDNGCDLPYLPVDQVEEQVEALWFGEQMAPEDVEVLSADLQGQLEQLESNSAREAADLDRQLARIETERERWAVAALEDTVPKDITRRKQDELAKQRETVVRRRAKVIELGGLHRMNLNRVLGLLGRCGYGYSIAANVIKRNYNQAWFEYVSIDIQDGTTIAVGKRHELAEDLKAVRQQRSTAVRVESNRLVNSPSDRLIERRAEQNDTANVSLVGVPKKKGLHLREDLNHLVNGSNIVNLAPAVGLEPTTVRLTVGCSAN